MPSAISKQNGLKDVVVVEEEGSDRMAGVSSNFHITTRILIHALAPTFSKTFSKIQITRAAQEEEVPPACCASKNSSSS